MMRCQRTAQKQHGMVIVMLVLVIVILLGVAALALDLGRLYVLKSEMQNAADAAALAGAAELNAEDDAIERAEAAARGLLQHDSHFAKVKALLGSDVDITITFYCSIGGEQDNGAACPGDADETDSNKILLSSMQNDVEAHYIRVTLDPEANNEDRYGIDLYFLPVLSVLGIDTSNTAVTTATALAGRHFYFCNYPPLMLCDPFEHSGGFRNNVSAGDQVLVKLQGGPNAKWSPGMFGFLDPYISPSGGASQLAPFLGNEGNMDCTPALVMPETGQMAVPMTSAMNTRFDEYGHPPFNKPDAYIDYPPATNITDYGGYYDSGNLNTCPPLNYCDTAANTLQPVCWRDSALRCPGGETRIGDGDWSREGYWEAKYGTAVPPPGIAGMSRYDMYMHEIKSGTLLDYDKPIEAHQGAALPGRRTIFVAVLSCDALGVEPNKVFPVVEPENGFAKLFITERSAGTSANNFFVEFMDWASEDDANYRVTVQLYE